MSKLEVYEKVAEQYRKEGYAVLVRPDKDQLPDFLKEEGIDLVAQKGSSHIAIQVKAREDLYDVNEAQALVPKFARIRSQNGWSFDLVVFPSAVSEDLPRNGSAQGPEYAKSIIAEAEVLAQSGALRGGLLLAWSAAEAAMREVAQRENIGIDNATPRFIIKSLYANGVISREQYERVGEYLALRNEVVHGFKPTPFGLDAVSFLIDFAKQLLHDGHNTSDGHVS